MSATPHLSSSDAEMFRLGLGRVWSYFTITGNTTDASSAATTANPCFKIFLEEGTDSGTAATVDSGANMTTLDDDANPAVVGFIAVVGDAQELYGLPVTVILSGDGTAFTPTLCGASTSGVSASYNVCYSQSMAGVDIDANTNVQKFTQEVFYLKR
jgi:hypothetical protein